MRRLYAFTINLVSHLSAGFDRDGLRGIISELRLIFTGKTYRGERLRLLIQALPNINTIDV